MNPMRVSNLSNLHRPSCPTRIRNGFPRRRVLTFSDKVPNTKLSGCPNLGAYQPLGRAGDSTQRCRLVNVIPEDSRIHELNGVCPTDELTDGAQLTAAW